MPGGMPSVTYVARERLGLEGRIAHAVARTNVFIIVSGPTKCGKTVLCRQVLKASGQIDIHGGLITSPDDFWLQLAHKMNLPASRTRTKTSTWGRQTSAQIIGVVPRLLKAGASYGSSVGGQDAEAITFNTVASLKAIEALKAAGTTLVIEDFHYLSKPTQKALVRALKAAVFDGLKVVLLSVPHHAFDPTDVEAEVEGRVQHVEIPRWSEDDLLQIPEKGFEALRLEIPSNVKQRICEDGFGNPHLVQEICLELAIADFQTVGPNELSRIYDKVVENKGLHRFDRIANGTADEGTPQMVELRSGGEDAMGMVLLAAVAQLGPKPLTEYADIRDSFASLSRANPPSPDQMRDLFAAMALSVSQSRATPLEWIHSRHELALSDPFLMFYMRWVLRDRRTLTLGQSALDTALLIQPTNSASKASEL